LLGGDAIRAITRGVGEMVADLIRAVIEEHARVSLTGEEKKRARSALTNKEVMQA